MQDSNFSKTAVLLLEDGTVFYGNAAGKIGITTGEICFNTGMTGYQEIFTDPSYYRQLVIMTNVHIGNYGIKNEEVESENVKIAGLICRNFTNDFSRQQADMSINAYFEQEGIVSIQGIDTRAVVRHIRDKGAMNAIISSEDLDIDRLKSKLSEVPSMKGLELSHEVTTPEPYFIGDPEAKYKVAVMDLGVKKNILKCMSDRGCYLKVFPSATTFEQIDEWNPDGYFISNGPGDPAPMDHQAAVVAKMLEKNKPLFGICLGHQILAKAVGIETFKMHNGHRGINHPVKNLVTGKSEITSQNHGFGVVASSIEAHKDKIEVTHVNLNDNSIEGIRIKGKNAFSVQYHPEASPGPHDSRYLFDEFESLMQKNK